MATLNRTLLTSGAALVTASAIVAAPIMAPGAGMIAGAPTPAALSTAQYELTALADITLQGINDAIANGYGGNLGPNDPYYPGVFDNATKVSGLSGALYYVLDKSGVVPFNLQDYYFEAGGVKAVAYVGVTNLFGANSLAGQLAKSVFVDGTVTLQDAIVTLTAGIPVLGELTSVYVNGTVAGDTTDYGTGFAGVAAYVEAKYPAIASLIGSLDLGKIGVGGRDESDDNESEDDSDSEDSEDDDSGSRSNGNGNGRWDDRVAAPAASAAAIAVSLPRPAAAASVAAVPSLASVSDNAPAEVSAPTVTLRSTAQDSPAAAAPKRESVRGARAGSADRPGAAAARGASARAAAATG